MNVTSTTRRGFTFGNFFGGLSANVEGYRLYRQTVKELSNLSDRELSDLNISRWDIDRIARDAVRSR